MLACGGFEWNPELVKAHIGYAVSPLSPPNNVGDGLTMATEVGAKLANLDKATWIPVRYSGEEYCDRPYVRSGGHGQMPGEIIVNRRGRRFTNETLNYNDIGRNMTHFDPNIYEYDNHPSYVIGDRFCAARLAAGGVAGHPIGTGAEVGSGTREEDGPERVVGRRHLERVDDPSDGHRIQGALVRRPVHDDAEQPVVGVDTNSLGGTVVGHRRVALNSIYPPHRHQWKYLYIKAYDESIPYAKTQPRRPFP